MVVDGPPGSASQCPGLVSDKQYPIPEEEPSYSDRHVDYKRFL